MTRSPDRWSLVQTLFHAALERGPADRAAFLEDACRSDPSLREEIESLLRHQAEGALRAGGAGLRIEAPIPEGSLTGARFGPYLVAELLGAGTMGEVYRAIDIVLKRQVALKVLPPAVASDAGHLARFRREAEVLAALNHPHIAHLYGLENWDRPNDQDSTPALVMELVEGSTLADRIARGPVPLPEALVIADQIADALAAAHSQGVVHRDLKPANIKVRPDGTVKVLDFGLAKALKHGSGADPKILSGHTISPGETGAGMLLGTVLYMSPERLRGEPADRKVDVWAFGCVCFEMLTGNPPFPGDDFATVAASIVRDAPDWTALPSLPDVIRSVIAACLEKDPRQRVGDLAAARFAIRESARLAHDAEKPRYTETIPQRGNRVTAPVVIDDGAAAEVVSVAAGRQGRRTSLMAVAVVAATVILVPATLVVMSRRTASHATPVGVLTPARVSVTGGMNLEPALSPDGSAVAVASDRSGSFEIYVVSLARGSQEIALTSDGKNSRQPAWSPDGRWIAFHTQNDGGLWLVPSTGGTKRRLVDIGSDPVWSPDSNWIVFTTQTSLVGQSNLRVIGRDGTGLRDLTHLGAPVGGHRNPAWSNNGRFIAFTTVRAADEASVWIVDASGGSPRHLQTAMGAGDVQFSSDDRALFFSGIGNVLYRLAIDPIQGTAAGQPPEVVLSVPGDFNAISMARTGLLAYGLTTTDTNLWTVDVARGADARDPARLTDDVAGVTTMPHYSPDGRRLTFLQGGSGGESLTPWVMNADGTGRSPLVTDGALWGWPSWAPDGTKLLAQRVTSTARTLVWIDLATRQLTPTNLQTNMQSPRLSPDGREIAYWTIETDGSANIWTQALSGGSPRRVTADAEAITYPWWSPDGQWLAVTMKRGTVTHVGVVPKEGGAVEQITDETGLSAPGAWSPDGEHIAFAGRRDGVWNVWMVSRRTRASRQLTHFTAPSDYVSYPSWSPDGHRIAFSREIRRGSIWTVQVR
jgi:serine/threonine protein kinase/Tol biopolymer transport system component